MDLEGKIAVVAGATRGAGRGIARMLGEAGVTVYCTGRSSRTGPPTDGPHAGRPETIEETADLVDAAGGKGIPVRVDHRSPEQVASLFTRVGRERQRLDVLVNVLGGPMVMTSEPLGRLDYEDGRRTYDAWVWPHVLTCRHAATLLRKTPSSLLVEVVEGDRLAYRGHFFFDLVLVALKRLAWAMAEELGPYGVTSVAVAPGFMRTEQVLDFFGASDEDWREVAEEDARARGFGLAGSETPCFVGRAVAALAADPELSRRNGGLFSSWQLAADYGFTDLDGTRPDWGRYGVENFPHIFAAESPTPYRWEVTAKEGAPAA